MAISKAGGIRGWLSGFLIAEIGLALALGGGEGLWADAFIQLCSLPLLGLAILSLQPKRLTSLGQGSLGLLACVALLPVLQLIPLPPWIWANLPGRTPFIAAYQAAAMGLPWEPLSLDPGVTWLSFLSLLPAISVFLALLAAPLKTRRTVSLVILGFALVGALLGVAQLAGGSESELRLYNGNTNAGDAVGFFANRSHHAAFLTIAIPLATVWVVDVARLRTSQSKFWLAMLLLGYAVLLLGLGMAHSRAGLILGFVAGFLSVAIAWRSKTARDGRERRKLTFFFVCANLLGLALAFQFGFVQLANRLENESALADLRRPIASVTMHAIDANLPMGTGFGAFEPVYQMFEPPALAIPEYINHAHDDWLELVLGGGIPALTLLLLYLLWYFYATYEAWREGDGSGVDRPLARAGSIVVGLLLLHSTVDYPLRMTSLMVVFAVANALMIAPSMEALSLGAKSARQLRPAGIGRRPRPANRLFSIEILS